MKNEIMELILESCECGDISLEDASAYMDFLECADLTDMDDVKVLTEMVDTLVDDYDMYYEATGKQKLSQDEIDRKKAEKRVKRNKVLKTVGKVAGAGAALAGVGYGAYKLGGKASDKRNGVVIDELRNKSNKLEKKLQVTKDAFRKANVAKRGSASTIDELRDKSNKLENNLQVTKDAFRKANFEKRWGNLLDRINTKRIRKLDIENETLIKQLDDAKKDAEAYAQHKRADAYKKALTGSGLAESMRKRAHVNLDDVRKHKKSI